MATQPTLVKRNVKVNMGRIVKMEHLVGRLAKRVERLEKQNAALKAAVAKPAAKISPNKIAQLEKQNASLKAELAKLRARVDQNAKDAKQNAGNISRLASLHEPVLTFVRSFKQTPGAPFETWRMWMLSTLRKRGVYRKPMFR